MNEEYYRANFSSATSTYQTKDSEGNRLAVLDVQLPSTLLDPESEIQDASVMLTKASIPLSGIPKVELEVSTVGKGADHIYSLITDCGFCLGNWFYATRENSNSGGLANRVFPNSDTVTYPMSQIAGVYSTLSKNFRASSRDELLKKHSPITYTNLTLFENDLNLALERVYGSVGPLVNNYNNTWKYPRIKIHFEEDTFKILIEHLDWDGNNNNNMRPLCGNSSYARAHNYFSIFISRSLAELLHGLPLVDVSSYYDKFTTDQDLEAFRKYGAFAIVLENLIPTYEQDDNGVSFEVFTFHFFNPLSLCPLNSIVIYSSNFPIEGQTHGIASETGLTSGSAQTSSMYILDVFYPLLTSEKDLEDVLIISKDAVTNTAPAKISPSALTFMHNITFNFGYITKKGYLRPIIIPPNANLSFQLTFILYS